MGECAESFLQSNFEAVKNRLDLINNATNILNFKKKHHKNW